LWGIGLGVIVLVGIGFAFFQRRTQNVPATIEPVSTPEAPAPGSAVVIAPQMPAEPAEVDAAAPAPSARPSTKKPSQPVKKTPSSKQSCRVLGADGIWHIRPGCL
jgi:hypothetical protein